MRLALVALIGLAACDIAEPDASSGSWRIASDPGDGSRDVERSGRFVVTLDRLVQPRSVSPAQVHLRSGAVAAAVSVRLWPVTRELWLDVAATRPLDPDVAYVLEVDGLIDLDGNPQPEPYRIVFRTGLAFGEPGAEASVDAAAAHALLQARCATAGCHHGATSAAHLDLGSPESVARTALGARSQLGAGTASEEGARGALSLAGLRIIDVVAGRGDPASSYLLYKLLGDPHVLGARMPKDGARLSAAELELLSEWILAGAPAP